MEPFTRLAQRVGKDDQLTPTARLLFAALDCHLDKRTGRCAPTLARLAGWVGLDRRNVQRALRQLEAAGYVEVQRSSGRRNAYRLLPTGGVDAAGTGGVDAAGTGGVDAAGTGGVDAAGQARAYLTELERTRGKEEDAPARPLDLYAGHYREWFTRAVRYHLAEALDVAELAAWFPDLVAGFFLAQSWHRQTDPETAVQWARKLAAIAADQAEAAEAFAWALASPAIDGAGRKVFSRPDHIARIVFRILTQRKRNRGPSAADSPGSIFCSLPGPASSASSAGVWASASDLERVEVAAIVRRRYPAVVPDGLQWVAQCALELLRMRARAEARADA